MGAYCQLLVPTLSASKPASANWLGSGGVTVITPEPTVIGAVMYRKPPRVRFTPPPVVVMSRRKPAASLVMKLLSVIEPICSAGTAPVVLLTNVTELPAKPSAPRPQAGA